MTYGLYRYTDDAGGNWAVSVPTDMATALSMTPATTEPNIDPTIAPRFANFQDASRNIRQGVIKSKVQFSTIIGTTITLGGVSFTGTSAKGESILALQPSLIQPPMALMGPPGPAGAAGTIPLLYQWAPSSDLTITPGGEQLSGLFSLISGKTYLLSGAAVFHGGSSDCDATIGFHPYGSATLNAALQRVPAGLWQTIALCGLLTAGATGSFQFSAANTGSNNITLKGTGSFYSNSPITNVCIFGPL